MALRFIVTPRVPTFVLVVGGKRQEEFDGELTWKIIEPVLLRGDEEFEPSDYDIDEDYFLGNFPDNFTVA